MNIVSKYIFIFPELYEQSLVSTVKDTEGPSTYSTNPENSEEVLNFDKSPSTISVDLDSPRHGKETPSKRQVSPSKSPSVEADSPKSG